MSTASAAPRRAGAAGTAISFCDAAERAHLLRGIEKLIRAKVPVLDLAA